MVKALRYKNVTKFDVLIFVVRVWWVLLRVANFTSKYDFSNLCSFRDDVFCDFFKKISENLFFFQFKIPIPVAGGCQRTNLHPNMAAHIFVVFQIRHFRKLVLLLFFKFEIPNSVVGGWQTTLRG